MARYTGPLDKLSRRLRSKLFLKAERDETDKSGFDRRPYPPGMHGHKRVKLSVYAVQLQEKQKVRHLYGLLERQLLRYLSMARKAQKAPGFVLLQLLEMRLDNVVFKLGLAGNIRQARQLVTHGHILVNGKKATIPSRVLKVGDRVSVANSSANLLSVQRALKSRDKRQKLEWLRYLDSFPEGVVASKPERIDLPPDIDEDLIIEYYTR